MIEDQGASRDHDLVAGSALEGWQPIETAPECQDILVCVTHHLGDDEWETIQWVDSQIDRVWMTFPRLIEVPCPPTRWMPLPQPPVPDRRKQDAPIDAPW